MTVLDMTQPDQRMYSDLFSLLGPHKTRNWWHKLAVSLATKTQIDNFLSHSSGAFPESPLWVNPWESDYCHLQTGDHLTNTLTLSITLSSKDISIRVFPRQSHSYISHPSPVLTVMYCNSYVLTGFISILRSTAHNIFVISNETKCLFLILKDRFVINSVVLKCYPAFLPCKL